MDDGKFNNDISEMEIELETLEDFKEVVRVLSKNDQILESRIIQAFGPLFQKIADLEYKLEMISRLEEKLFIKMVDTSKEYVQKVTLNEYRDLAKICKRELDADTERAKKLMESN